MKKSLMRVFLILSVISAFLLLFGCKEKKGDEENTEEPAEPLTMIDNGEVRFEIVYPYRAGDEAQRAVAELRSALRERYGVSVTLTDDFDDVEASESGDLIQILVGDVDRTESKTVSEKLVSDVDWALCTVDHTVVLSAKKEAHLEKAVQHLISMMETNTQSWVLPGNLQHYYLAGENQELLHILDHYSIVYSQNASARVKKAANQLSSSLSVLLTGHRIEAHSDASPAEKYEILIGETNRPASAADAELTYYDYCVTVLDNQIVVNAGGGYAMENALEQLYSMLAFDELENTMFRFDSVGLNPYALHPESFVPAWSGEITVPEWMTNFEEKLYAITNPEGRLMCVAHRGDVIHYPEDSLEGILSAAMLGADVIEFDLCMTKDRVLVLMHDTSLTRTTNVLQMKGKNGLPDSEDVSDWTFMQLRQLSLLDTDQNITEYKIPSYYEVLLALRGRCFLMIDQKTAGYAAEDILEIEAAVGALECSIYSMFVSGSSGPAQGNSWSYMTEYSEAHPELLSFAETIQKLNTYMNLPGHTIRSRGWIEKATTNPSAESPELYEKAFREKGIRLLYCNNMPAMSQHIAENYQPDLTDGQME